MSIIFWIFVGTLLASIVLLLGFGPCDTEHPRVVIMLAVLTIIVTCLIGVSADTNGEIAYVAKYEAQKATIEQSLKTESLSGLEKIELVNKATDLNGELAEKKAKFNLWYHVHFDNHIYDNVSFIEFGG